MGLLVIMVFEGCVVGFVVLWFFFGMFNVGKVLIFGFFFIIFFEWIEIKVKKKIF